MTQFRNLLEAQVWAQFAAAAVGPGPASRSKIADEMLASFRERMPPGDGLARMPLDPLAPLPDNRA